jgi:hypothetical protein
MIVAQITFAGLRHPLLGLKGRVGFGVAALMTWVTLRALRTWVTLMALMALMALVALGSIKVLEVGRWKRACRVEIAH